MMTGFNTPWKAYTSSELDRFDVDDQIVFVARDRTCAFVANRHEGNTREPHQADERELQEIWMKHRLIALLPVFRSFVARASRPC
jgi:hypothetical protein